MANKVQVVRFLGIKVSKFGHFQFHKNRLLEVSVSQGFEVLVFGGINISGFQEFKKCKFLFEFSRCLRFNHKFQGLKSLKPQRLGTSKT
jgi:hypothetical protein